MSANEKLVLISTMGNENAEKASLPFVVATAAQACDVEAVIILQSDAVVLAKQGEAEKVNAKGFMPLKQLMDTYISLGGKLLICTPCLKERNISENDLVEGSTLVAGGTVVAEVMSAKSVITY